jgi:CheY-like chemotaxis protein
VPNERAGKAQSAALAGAPIAVPHLGGANALEAMMEDDTLTGGRRMVLYVDDHPVNALVMQSLFRHRPALDLAVAADGAEALERAQDLAPALLLLDLHLPDCHGTELLQRLRQFEHCAEVPAVAVTADQYFEPRGTGFVEVWCKPLNVRAVLERLDRLIGAPGALLQAAALPRLAASQAATG